MYDLVPAEDGVPRLVEGASSACTSGAVISGGDSVDWSDELGDGEALVAMSTGAVLSSESFFPQKQASSLSLARSLTLTLTLALTLTLTPTLVRTPSLSLSLTQGNMAVGNAFTLSSGPGSEPLLLELGLKEAAERVRAKLVYDLDESGGAPQMRLRRVAIVRETSGSSGASDAILGRPGSGLYDVPAGDKEKYCSLYCEGGLTLVCPFVLPLAPDEARGCISLDWTGAKMRYQADRKFDTLDGSLRTFELTEILSTDSQDYTPDFKGYDRD